MVFDTVGAACEHAQAFALQGIARPIADRHRQSLLDSLPERESFITAGYRYEEDQLLAQRVMKAAQAREGDSKAAADLAMIKDRQRALETLKDQALATIEVLPPTPTDLESVGGGAGPDIDLAGRSQGRESGEDSAREFERLQSHLAGR